MKMKNIKTLFLALVLITLNYLQSSAQSDSCITYLKNANTNYEQRDFDGAIKLLQTSLSNCNLDRADKIQAHKLLAMSYIGIDNLEAADKEAEAIIKINPNYLPDKFKDEPRYSALFEKFKPIPILSGGVSMGFNRSTVDVKKTYSIVHNDDADNLGEYKSKSGFQLGLQARYRAYKNFWVELGGFYRQSSYEHILFDVENTDINYSEKLSYIDIPLGVKYYIMDNTFSPYVQAGANFSFLANALGTTERDDQKDIVNRIDYRNTYTTGFFGGAGVAYRMKSFSLFADFRYNYYGDNVNKDGTRYADLVNVFKYYYIDDDFKMSNWQVNAGVNYSIAYKNKKVK